MRAAFMPLQCGICEGIRIVLMLLDMPTLRRNKFRVPRFMGTKRAKFRKGFPMNFVVTLVGLALPRHLSIGTAQ